MIEAYVLDWLNLLVRWLHLITGIAWIGASFYFIWLDNHLEAPKRDEDKARGVGGELWAVHGGGFYHAEKFKARPPAVPERLHWFKWEAYWTWASGFLILVIVYYIGAELALIDPAVAKLDRATAIAIGIGSIVGGWVVYDLLCKSPLARNDTSLTACLFGLLCLAAYGLTQVFGGRGAYMHFGAILGTIMVANVAMVIIPGHKAMVKAAVAGVDPDPRHGIAGKQRSVHNTYFTLPVVFVMMSNHYAFTYAHRYNWLLLILMSVAGALIRVWFVDRHRGKQSWRTLLLAAAMLAAIAWIAVPQGSPSTSTADIGQVRAIIAARCASCHSERPTQAGIAAAPKGVAFDTDDKLRAAAALILQQSVLTAAMPPGNLTAMSEAERAALGRWATETMRAR